MTGLGINTTAYLFYHKGKQSLLKAVVVLKLGSFDVRAIQLA